jgi:hypothetical protein
MQESTTIRRMSARTAAAVLLAVVGMLALGGAWNSAVAEPGNGGGNATGRPDDGTVGNGNPHDNKPDPSQNDGKGEGNKGHECDDNHGVGQGNPAHPNDCTTPTTVHSGGCTNPDGCDGGGGGGGGSTVTTETPTTAAPQAEVLGLTEEAPAAAPGAAPAADVAGATELAFTGATSDVLGFLAVALLAFGTAIVLVARKPQEFMTV